MWINVFLWSSSSSLQSSVSHDPSEITPTWASEKLFAQREYSQGEIFAKCTEIWPIAHISITDRPLVNAENKHTHTHTHTHTYSGWNSVNGSKSSVMRINLETRHMMTSWHSLTEATPHTHTHTHTHTQVSSVSYKAKIITRLTLTLT